MKLLGVYVLISVMVTMVIGIAYSQPIRNCTLTDLIPCGQALIHPERPIDPKCCNVLKSHKDCFCIDADVHVRTTCYCYYQFNFGTFQDVVRKCGIVWKDPCT